MTVLETPLGGWRPDLERPEDLAASRLPIPYSAIPGSTMPETIDRGAWVHVEDQGDMGSCQGQSLSTGVELCRTVHGGRPTQLSRMGAYIMSQREDGIRGDTGSTISAGVEVAMNGGLVREELWPYPNRYDDDVPAAYAAADKYRIGGHSDPTSAEECLKHLPLGTIHLGVMWSAAVDRAVANNGAVLDSWPTGGAGGHAVEGIGYRVTNYQGEPLPGADPYLEIVNSWSPRWGFNGRFLCSPRCVEQMLSSKWAVFVAIYGAATPPIEPAVIPDLAVGRRGGQPQRFLNQVEPESSPA